MEPSKDPIDEEDHNSYAKLMGTVDATIKELNSKEKIIVPEGHVNLEDLIQALDTLQKDIRQHLERSGKIPSIDEIAKEVDLEQIQKRILDIQTESGGSDEFLSVANEFAKPKALETMALVLELCKSISSSIDMRNLEIENEEISDDVVLKIQYLDENTRASIKNARELLRKIEDFFPWSTTDSKWREKIQSMNEILSEEITFSEGFEDISGFLTGLPRFDLVFADARTELPAASTFLELSFRTALHNIYGQILDMFVFISKSKPLDLGTLLSPYGEIEDRNEFGKMLIEKAELLTTVPFEISKSQSDEINDLLSNLISAQTAFLRMLEKLELGFGRYRPNLSNVNSHMIVYKESPRTAFEALPMWPMKRRERYDKLRTLDIFNWLGRDYHSEQLDYDEEHKIAYRDFLNYIQQLGFEHKMVTHYDDSVRVQPKLTTFIWNMKNNKYRKNASIYFYCQKCPYTNREMRISLDTSKSMYGESITINVGLDFFQKDAEMLNVPRDEQILHQRELAEEYCTNLLGDFIQFQKENGLLKNTKFNAYFTELELKGRTFDDLILPDEKKQLIDDNIFAILRHSPALIERGVETNRGIMLAGPPGVGKSLTIDAIIAEGDCTILFADFIMLHKRMDMIFDIARKYAPTILIMEDIDALGITSQRGQTSDGSGLSTLLNHMDGIKDNNGVITIATSNHPELLDWALIARPGRFDVRIDYPYPTQEILTGIFKMKVGPYPKEDGINLENIVKKMPLGFTGSHIQDIVNQANYISMNDAGNTDVMVKITQTSLESAFERALYNFNKFLMERPNVKFEQEPDASAVIKGEQDDDLSRLFG